MQFLSWFFFEEIDFVFKFMDLSSQSIDDRLQRIDLIYIIIGLRLCIQLTLKSAYIPVETWNQIIFDSEFSFF